MTEKEMIQKIADIVEGTIEDIDYDEAMDMLYDIKDVLKDHDNNIEEIKEGWHNGCDDCKYETYPDSYYPCCDCKQNYVDKYQMKEGD